MPSGADGCRKTSCWQLLAAELADLARARAPPRATRTVVDARGARRRRARPALPARRATATREFLRMNSNSYLGMGCGREVIAAEEEAARAFGAGPGAVRFISGTYDVARRRSRQRLAALPRPRGGDDLQLRLRHRAVGVFVPLVTDQTALISDELNHNCIINAMRLARPTRQGGLPPQRRRRPRARSCVGCAGRLPAGAGGHRRHLLACAATTRRSPRSWRSRAKHDAASRRTWCVVVDDSHGVGAFGADRPRHRGVHRLRRRSTS